LIRTSAGIDADETEEIEDEDKDKAVVTLPQAPALGNINSLLGTALISFSSFIH
jgi:hypothetical protein